MDQQSPIGRRRNRRARLAKGQSPLAGRRLSAAVASARVEAVEARTLFAAAAIDAPDVRSAGGDSVAVTVTYTDDKAVNVNSVGSSDVTVVNEAGGAALTLRTVSVSPRVNAATLVATYTFAAPGGRWDGGDNGSYRVNVEANRVFDQEGNAVPPTTGTFVVDVPGGRPPSPPGGIGNNPGDGVAPIAILEATPAVTAAGGTSIGFTAIYTDDRAVNPQTVGTNDLVVTKPDGDTLTVTTVATEVSDGGRRVVARYTATPPGGAWDAGDNGTYTATVRYHSVLDGSGLPVQGAAVPFVVAVPTTVPPPPPAADAPPTAELAAARDVTTAGATYAVTVTYRDDTRVAESSVDKADVTVTGPGGPLTAIGVETDASSGGRVVEATYRFAAAGGSWDAADNGAYRIALAAGSVTDSAGQGVGGAAAGFDVTVAAAPVSPPAVPPVVPPSPPTSPPNVPPPPPVSEPPPPTNQPPVATISPPEDIASPGAPTQAVVVTYVDDDALNESSIDVGDVLVTGPGGPLAVTGVTVAGAGNVFTATYTVAAPGNVWDAADAGAYTVAVLAGQVADAAGATNAAAASGFDVTITPPQPVVDPAFSGGQPLSSGFVAEAAVTLEDGKLVLAGRQGNLAAGSSQAVVKRLNPDGSPDLTFGRSGLVVTAAGENQAAYAATLLPDGGFLTAGTLAGDMLVTKYRPNGTPDTRFGTGGRATVDAGAADDVAYSVAVAADGSVYVGGSSDGSFAFAKLTAAGMPDTFFGTRGVSLFRLGTGDNVIGGIGVQADGKIVGVGAAGTGVAVVRLNPDGSEDAAFGTDGSVTVARVGARSDLNAADRTLGLALQPDGKILMTNQAGDDFAVARLNPDGSVDDAFGAGGVATVDFGADDDADAVVVQGSGEILVVGTTTAAGGKTGIAALNADGSLDERFGQGGKFTLDPGVTTAGRALHVGDLVLRAFATASGDGLVVGTSQGGTNAISSSGLQRLNVPGSGLLGRFGTVGGKTRKLRFADADGTVVTITMKGGGSGQAFYDEANVDLVLSGTGPRSAVSIKTDRSGDGRLSIRDVQADGGLKSFAAKTGDLAGTFWVGGEAGTVALGTVTGTVAADGSIATLSAAGDVSGAKVLAGADLGADHKLGGGGANADGYQSGTIKKITVAGRVAGSIFGAGLNRKNGAFLDNDDVIEGGEASRIVSVTVKKGVDESTRFVAGSFGPTVKLPERVVPLSAQDKRFVVR